MIVKVADFRNNMAEYLRHVEETIYLTRHGKVVGVVCAPDGSGRGPTSGEIGICLHEIKVRLERLESILEGTSEKRNGKSDR